MNLLRDFRDFCSGFIGIFRADSQKLCSYFRVNIRQNLKGLWWDYWIFWWKNAVNSKENPTFLEGLEFKLNAVTPHAKCGNLWRNFPGFQCFFPNKKVVFFLEIPDLFLCSGKPKKRKNQTSILRVSMKTRPAQ